MRRDCYPWRRFAHHARLPLLGTLSVMVSAGCANFRKLGHDLALIEKTSIVTCVLENRPEFASDVYGLVIEWGGAGQSKVRSADFCKVGQVGVFGFGVERRENQFLLAFCDANGNAKYEPGEPAWVHAGPGGTAAPVPFGGEVRSRARLKGVLSTSTVVPAEMVAAARAFRGGRTLEEAATGWSIPIALGDIADIDDPKFASQLGQEGLWQPLSFPMKRSIGVYFLEEYDPGRTPVLFVYGASGSPQDWRTVFSKLDSDRYQAWFYFYPTGARLKDAGSALARSVDLLHNHYQFSQLHVVAHSMGGLVARSFLVENVVGDGNRYIQKFVSISTPWNGHEAAALGVTRAPEVVPSWYDMQTGSEFQKEIFSESLKGEVEHLLIYGHRSSKSRLLPAENDGTVSVASMTSEDARHDAAEIAGYDEDHMTILANAEVIAKMEAFLAAPPVRVGFGQRLGDKLDRPDPLFE